ncbi:MAG: rubredoxin [bacterium]
MAIYECEVCGFEYDEQDEIICWDDLPEDWVCPVCGVTKDNFFQQTSEDEDDDDIPDSIPEADL